MPARRPLRSNRDVRVFLNVPYSTSYEKVLVALTAALVALGRVPQLTFQVPDGGQGRIKRIFELVQSCRVSVHDLSAVGLPVRFNMPFELGLAYAVKAMDGPHDFLILEKKSHRLDRHLSDLKAIDPKIHGGTARGAISAILEVLDKPGKNPSTAEVMKVYHRMRRFLPLLKIKHGKNDLFTTRVYGELAAMGLETAQKMGL